MNSKLTLLALCVALTLLSGVLRGVVDQRWGYGEEMLQAAERVASFPMEIGPWKATEDGKLDDEAAAMLRSVGSVLRRYTHEATGETISLVFLVGPAGPLAIHTPEVCYGSNNFTVVDPRGRSIVEDVQGNEHPFSVVTFAENDLRQRRQRIYYAWNHQNTWIAPEQPRSAFAGLPMLYKVQVSTYLQGDGERQDAANKFLSVCLPICEQICR